MKRTFLWLFLPLMAMIFNSCSKDEGGIDIPKYAKLLKMITNDNGSVLFEYDDQQRITKVIWSDQAGNPDLVDTYTHINNNVWVSNRWGYSVFFDFDNDGYIIGENGFRHMYADGHIKTKSSNGYTRTKSENELGNISSSYTWTNGNLTQIIGNDVDCTYTYNNVENKLNVNIFDMDGFGIDYMIFDDGDTFTNFKGTFSKNYPVTAKMGNHTATFSYTYDSEIYPTKIVVDRYNPLEGAKTITYTLTYY